MLPQASEPLPAHLPPPPPRDGRAVWGARVWQSRNLCAV